MVLWEIASKCSAPPPPSILWLLTRQCVIHVPLEHHESAKVLLALGALLLVQYSLRCCCVIVVVVELVGLVRRARLLL